MNGSSRKSRLLRWRKQRNASANDNSTVSSPRIGPRQFASKVVTQNTKPSSVNTANSENVVFQPLRDLAAPERDAKILFGIVPTILALGYLMTDKDSWLSTMGAIPLVTILTGFGILGRDNYKLEDNNISTNANTNTSVDESNSESKDKETPPTLLKSRTSSMSTQSTNSINHSDATIAIEGIDVPVGCEVNGAHLDRHGSGLRCFAFFRGITVRVYVATFYASQSFTTGQDILDASHDDDAPLQLDFTFLRGFTASQCRMAWQKQLDQSITYSYSGLSKDKQVFLEKVATQSMKAKGTISVQLLDDRTVIFDQGKYTGEVVGRDFQEAFLSMWFGDQPVTEELKTRLLGKEQSIA